MEQRRRLLHDLQPVRRTVLWFRSDASLWHKLTYFPHLALSLAGLPFGRRRVRYLGRGFVFDNVAAPLNLQVYPNEITRRLLANMPVPPRTVLDVGGNIGQFTRTLSEFAPLVHVDVIEPNTTIVPLLRRNLQHLGPAVRIHEVALGEGADDAVLHYEPGRSAIGSVISANAGARANLATVDIHLEPNAAELTGRRHYDLIKIDVEGFEIEAVRALHGMTTGHLLIEVSGPGRDRNYTDAELFAAITEALGDFSIVHSSGTTATSVHYDLLLRFTPTATSGGRASP